MVVNQHFQQPAAGSSSFMTCKRPNCCQTDIPYSSLSSIRAAVIINNSSGCNQRRETSPSQQLWRQKALAATVSIHELWWSPQETLSSATCKLCSDCLDPKTRSTFCHDYPTPKMKGISTPSHQQQSHLPISVATNQPM